jgi:tetratricopeptide (TPR) repeat protein
MAGDSAEEKRRRQPELSPDQPMHYYWLRTERGAPGDLVAMDPRLKEVSDAFGAGDFERARQLAQALLEDPDAAPDVGAEAAAYLAESYLAQGEFEKAGQIAEEHEDTEIAARVASLKRGYAAALSRLDLTLAGAVEERAALAFRRARVHRQAGCLELAQASYWRVISEHRGSAEAVRAASEIVNMHQAYGTPESVTKVCETLVGLDPDSDAAVATCQAVSGPWAAWRNGESASAMDILRRIAETYPNTRAGAASGLDLGQLLLASGQYEQADEVWSRLVDENGDVEVSQEARYRLADLRYERGMKAFTESDYESAARWLGKLRPEVDLIGTRSPTLRFGFGDSPESRMRHAVFSLGEACEKLERWGEAAEAFAGLTVPGNPAEEIALFRLVRCYVNMGDWARARGAYDSLAAQFPGRTYTREAQKLL